MYLLDTNVVSELRKVRPHGAVLEWIHGVPDRALFLSALTVGELQAGAERTRQQDPTKAEAIDAWIDQLAAAYEVIPIDAGMFREWARLMAGKSDHLLEDAMIAATASEFNDQYKAGAYIAAGLVLFILTFVVNSLARAAVAGRGAKS